MAYTTRQLTAEDAPAVAALQNVAVTRLMQTGQHPADYPLKAWDDGRAQRWIDREFACGVFDGAEMVGAWFGSVVAYKDTKAALAEWRFKKSGLTEAEARAISIQASSEYTVPRMKELGLTVLVARFSTTIEAMEKRLFTDMGMSGGLMPEDARFEQWTVNIDDLEKATTALREARGNVPRP